MKGAVVAGAGLIGMGALAILVLLFVGVWMHGKAQAGEWQRYISEKLSSALSARSAGFLFLLAFIAVYREVFETILFFVALSAQGNVGALLAGAAVGLALLAAIAIAMFRFSARLPIAKFFAYSSALIAVLALVLAGKGIAAGFSIVLLGILIDRVVRGAAARVDRDPAVGGFSRRIELRRLLAISGRAR